MPRHAPRRRRRPLLAAAAVLLIPSTLLLLKVLATEHAGLWLPGQMRDVVDGRAAGADDTEHLLVIMADHWEPGREEHSRARAAGWLERFRPISERHRDTRGRPFRYTWFYPIDRRNPEILDMLAHEVTAGYGEVEVHWHHHHDDPAAFERDLIEGLADFRAAGVLPVVDGGLRWAFIHGNWALDNSIDGQCGMNDEVAILQRHGCVMDMTFPAILMPSNPRQPNRLLRMTETPDARSYDDAREIRVGESEDEGLLLFQGPLGLDPTNLPVFVEYGALDDAAGTGWAGRVVRPDSPRDYFRPSRVRAWHRAAIAVEGRPEWTFVKLHAHGMQDEDLMLGGLLDAALDELERYAQAKGLTLHYVTARETYNVVRAAERGFIGDPADYYDLEIPPAPAATRGLLVSAAE